MLDAYEVQQQLAELYQEREERMIQLEELEDALAELVEDVGSDERERFLEERDDVMSQIDEIAIEVARLEEQLDSLGN
ncbi:MAG TPA: hypothetical protein PK297_13910 [Spirochaetota bacterium]|nr:hypothetical protein [Spirochaetota bacterium]